MAKASNFEKRLAALEKTITDFFTGGGSKSSGARKKTKRKSAKKAKKTAARKTAKRKR